jgi:NADH:ubiquinone oxidoreductase subunit 5 (subunit L)/multisubunit Na+/H+ antiporter MnhA subunit
MLVLVLGGNFPVMFVGWEGVGSARTCSSGSGSESSQRRRRQEGICRQVVSGTSDLVLGMLLIFTTFRHARLPAGRRRRPTSRRAIHGAIGV